MRDSHQHPKHMNNSSTQESKQKIAFLSLFLVLLAITAKANPIDLRQAREVGARFINANTRMRTNANDLRLATTYNTTIGTPAFHVFNTANGFVIVAADDCATPILGYSDEGRPFDPNGIPIQMEEYLQGFVEQIQYGVENHIQPNESTSRQWEMVMDTGRLNDNRTTNAVEPLLTERWDQGCYYNTMCPEDSQGPCGHVLVGCVATAMGQIMHYWGYPATGAGSYSYKPIGYPIQSVNFYETNYDWANMPDDLTSSSTETQIHAVATLLWHCGVSVDMMYGAGSSGANSYAVPNALINYFNYEEDLVMQSKGNNNEEWIAQVKSCIDQGRPLYYSARNAQEGHAFVCDGYDTNDYLHFNWGWSGTLNGYFAVTSMVNGYNSDHAAIFNIHPHEGTETYTITTESSPTDAGTTMGGGAYHYGTTATLTATPTENYLFDNWTLNGHIISSSPTCYVTVREDATYVANFRRTNIYDVVIGDNTLSSEYLPITSSSHYSLTQQILLADSINANGSITDISFYYTGGSVSSDSLSISLFLKHTQRSSFVSETDWEPLASTDLFFSGSYIIDSIEGWKQIHLDIPFFFNGVDNLLVCVDNNTNSDLTGLAWAIYPTNDSHSLIVSGNEDNFDPYNPVAGVLDSYNNYIALTFQVTQGTDFVFTPYPIDLGFRPSGAWMRPFSVDFFNSGMTTTITSISANNDYFTIGLSDTQLPFICEYQDHGSFEVSTGLGNGQINDSLVITYGNGQTKLTPLTATAYTPTVADVWETALELTSFPFSVDLSNTNHPLYNNYYLPNTDIPDGPDAVYKIVLNEENWLNASVTNGENGKVALYTEDFKGYPGPDNDNNYDSNSTSSEWLYYAKSGGSGSSGSDGNFYWGIKFPASMLQNYLYSRLTKIAIYEDEHNNNSITLNIYLGGESAPETLVLTQEFMPIAFRDYHEIILDSDIPIDGTQNLWITFHQESDLYPAAYGPYTEDPNGCFYSLDGSYWTTNHFSWAIKGYVTNAYENQRDFSLGQSVIDQMFLMPGTYYLVASSTSDNWSLEINAQPHECPELAYDPTPAHNSTEVDYILTQLSWIIGEGTTEYMLRFGKTPNCERVLVTWSDSLANSYTFTDNLDWNTTYYWKVCERSADCPNGTDGTVWSFTTQGPNEMPHEITAEVYPDGGTVNGAGTWVEGSTCTLTAIPAEGYEFIRWTIDGRTLSTSQSYDFVVHGDEHLIAIFASTDNISFADENVKSICVSWWDRDHDGELSYNEAALVTHTRTFFANNQNITRFDELASFTGLNYIDGGSFSGCSALSSITIPRFVLDIESNAFSNNHALASIKIVENNPYYDSRNNCNAIIKTNENRLVKGFNSTIIPNTIITIGHFAFLGCQNLTTMVIPNSVVSIEEGAFYNCHNLSSIDLPNSLVFLGYDAFFECEKLTSIYIPESLIQIDRNPFTYCPNLRQIVVASDNPRYDSRYDCNTLIETSTNRVIVGCAGSIIPNDVVSLADAAFLNCLNLRTVTIPRFVDSIGNNTFEGCRNLESITVIAETPPSLGAYPFFLVDMSQVTINVPCNTSSIYQSSEVWRDFPNYQETGYFRFEAHSTNPQMGSVELVQIPDCTSSTAVVVAQPNTGCIFDYWKMEDEIVSTNLQYEVSVDSDMVLMAHFTPLENWNNYIHFADTLVKAICVANWDIDGDGELSYGEAAAVSNLGSVFKNTAISTFDELQYFTGLTMISSFAFQSCENLLSVIIPDNVTHISSLAFYWDGNLRVKLPSQLTRIEQRAFYNCRFTSLVIPNTVTYIGSQAFASCNIQDLTVLAETPPSINSTAFQYVNKRIPVYVPCGTANLYRNAEYWSEFTNYHEIIPYDFFVTSADPTMGTVTILQEPDCGIEAIVQATANEGYSFVNWTDNESIVSTQAEYQFFLDTNMNLVAHFEPIIDGDDFIVFEDFLVKAICVANWDTNEDGEISYNEASVVTDIGSIFSNKNIVSFHEFKYLSGLTSIPDSAFAGCESLNAITLPNTVTSIGSSAFHGCHDLVSIQIPYSVISLGEKVFRNCSSLTSIYIPRWVLSIGEETFAGCSELHEIIVNNSNAVYDSRNHSNAIITTATNTLDFGCKGTIIQNTVENINEYAFSGSTKLSYIIIPNSITTINSYAFKGCQSLTSIIIPQSVVSLANGVFADCSSMESIVVNQGNTVYDSRNNCNAIVHSNTNTLHTGCLNTEIPQTVVAIGEEAFYGCSNLDIVTIPNTITSIGSNAFGNCNGITSLTSLAIAPPLAHSNAFNGMAPNVTVIVPCESLGAYENAPTWSSFSNLQGIMIYDLSVVSDEPTMGTVAIIQEPDCDIEAVIQAIPNEGYYFYRWMENEVVVSTEAVYQFALSSNRQLVAEFTTIGDWDAPIDFVDPLVKSICVSNCDTNGDGEISYNEAATVTNIGTTFSNKTIVSFDELQYFTGLTTLPMSAFNNCTQLQSVIIPETVTSLGDGVFRNCSSLTSLFIPRSVQSIGTTPFAGCSQLNEIVVDSRNTTYDSRDNCNAIIYTLSNRLDYGCKGTVIPNTIQMIKEYAFAYCPELTSITIPSSVYSVQANAFSNCPSLTSIVIPRTLLTIGLKAYYNCPAIESIVVEEGNPYYDSRDNCNAIIRTSTNTLFTGCKNTQIPSSVVSIGDYAFYGCTNLESFTIPNSISSIGNTAFGHCSGLVSIIIPNSVSTIGEGSFEYCTSLVSISIPQFVTDIPKRAFYQCTSLRTVSFPNNLISIGNDAFQANHSLNELVLPATITSIGSYAFGFCENLSFISIRATTPPYIQNNTFMQINTSIPVYVLCGTSQTYGYTSGWNLFNNYHEILPYDLSISSANETMGTVVVLQEPGCETNAIIQALPNAGHAFQSWQKDGVTVSTNPTYSFTLTENSHYTAFFVIQEGATYIFASANPTDGGTITGAGSYNQGTTCTLTAIANEDYVFARWREGNETVSTDSVYTFQVMENRNLIADFIYIGTLPGVLNGVFSTNENTRVHFSQGNLQYRASTNTWRFAESQLDCAGNNNSSISSSYNGWIDLFGWGTSGYNHGAVCYQPWSTSLSNSSYYAYGNSSLNLFDGNGKADWGFNLISNGGNQSNEWRTLTTDEWDFIFNYRTTASGIRYAKAKVNNVCGILLFPDNWDASYFTINSPNNGSISYNNNTITASQWSAMEQQGVVFLPAAGWRGGSSTNEVNGLGNYWSSSACTNSNYAYVVYFNNSRLGLQETFHDRMYGRSVRLVYSPQSAISYFIKANPNPAEGGTVTGTGLYEECTTCTLTATANDGYTFTNWTENGEVVSSDNPYSFIVVGSRNLVANFTVNGGTAIEGMLNGVFSVGDDTHVHFSQGNLQFIGSAPSPYWKFADHQWDYLGDNGQGDPTETVDRDLFGWGTSGYDHGAVCYQPWSTSTNVEHYYAYGSSTYNLYDQTGQADWGYNAISNGGDNEGLWRTLTLSEWDYLLYNRTTASGIRFVMGKVGDENGIILLPDDWSASIYTLNDINGGNCNSNIISITDWNDTLETNGAVFLPFSGFRALGTVVTDMGFSGAYWSSSYCDDYSAKGLVMMSGYLDLENCQGRVLGYSVRLVKNVEFSVTTSAANNVGHTTATLNGQYSAPEGMDVNEVGFYWGTSIANMNRVVAELEENFTYNLTGLAEGTTYCYMAFAQSGEIEKTGTIQTFTTLITPTIPEGIINSKFSVNANGDQVYFSQGNLQYIGSAATPYWKFAENQWDFLGITTGQNSSNQNVDRDLFGWGTSGYNHGAVCYQPWSTSTTNGDYYAYGNANFNLYDQTNQADWGYNAISNGGNTENMGWRTPTTDEWDYIFNTRTASTVNGVANARFAKAKVADVQGMILFPDNYTHPSQVTQPVGINSPGNAGWTGNNYSSADFALMEANGAVFLPAAGDRSGSSVIHIGTDASYWSSSHSDNNNAYHLLFYSANLVQRRSVPRKDGDAVRLIIPVMNNSSYDINATPNPAESGTVTGTGLYEEGTVCTLTATANDGYTFNNWTENGEVVSSDNPYSFIVVGSRNLVANFTENQNNVTQTTELPVGWIWWSTYIDMEGYNSLGMLEEALGTNALQIKSQDGFAQYIEIPGYGGYWYGTLDTILSNRQTYMIQASSACQIEISGTPVSPADHPITILPGWNWIGFPSSSAISFTDAFADFTPTDGDQVKSQSSFTQYMEIPGYGGIWYGGLEAENLTPGMGLMYKSMGVGSATLVYPNAGRSVENVVSIEKHWNNNIHAYSSNMTLMAVVELDDVELTSDNYELAAFANGECRGSAKLTFVEPINRHMAFLTISGDEATELSFGLYDNQIGTEIFDCSDLLTYSTDAIVGKLDEPMIVRFNGTNSIDEIERNLHIYPNPVSCGEHVSITLSIDSKVHIEIIDALGTKVSSETTAQAPAYILAPSTPGVFTIRITVGGKGVYNRKLIVK